MIANFMTMLHSLPSFEPNMRQATNSERSITLYNPFPCVRHPRQPPKPCLDCPGFWGLTWRGRG